MKLICSALVVASLLTGVMPPLAADVTLPALFSEHAVLQKTARVPIWGKADPGEKVVITLGTAEGEALADAAGKWKATLDLSASAPGPFELTVAGKNKLAIPDVVVGEVWVCSGQSNMEFTLTKTIDAATEIPASTNPLLRQFLVKKNSVTTPQDECEGAWTVAGPATSGAFPAVGYYMGKELQQELKVPVGLINNAWGGSVLEAWTSQETLEKNPDLQARTDELLTEINSMDQRMKDFQTKFEVWGAKYDRKDKPGAKVDDFAGTKVAATGWKTVQLPGLLSSAGLPDSGAIWIRHNVAVAPGAVGHSVVLDLGTIHQFDDVYWNGARIDGTTPATPGSVNLRRYMVPGDQVLSGDNVLAVRIFAPAGDAGIAAEPDGLKAAATIPLSGDWLAKEEFAFPPASPAMRGEYPAMPQKLPEAQFRPACLFNGMIHPLIPYAIKGVVWYQGEANATRAYQYRTAFPAMIQDWRVAWGEGDFPFYWCQLANFTLKKAQPDISSWAELREAQTMTLAVPHTGQAVLIDLGEEGDIHPRDKKSAGERLCKVVLAQSYGRKDVAFAGPSYQSMTVEGDKIRLQFVDIGGGLVARTLPETFRPKSGLPRTVPLVHNSPGSELEGFAICGDDQKWTWAQAKIEKNTVLVWSPEVPKPVAVRYAWANNPTCNLYNQAGLPAVPFRTDDFPGSTRNGKF